MTDPEVPQPSSERRRTLPGRQKRRSLFDWIGLALLAAALIWLLSVALLGNYYLLVSFYLGLPILGLALASLFFRSYVAALVFGASALALILPFVPQFAPGRGEHAPGCELKVLTFSTRQLSDNKAQALELVARHQPDVAFLQELYLNQEELVSFVERTPGLGAYFPQTMHNVAVLSKVPFSFSQRRRSGDPDMPLEMTIEGKTVYAWSFQARKTSDGMLRRAERTYFERLGRQLDIYDGPKIVAGDFNAAPVESSINPIRERSLRDAFAVAGYGIGPTFPGPARRIGLFGPWVRIDYIFASRDFAVKDARRLHQAVGSDHFPVEADLIFIDRGRNGERCTSGSTAASSTPPPA